MDWQQVKTNWKSVQVKLHDKWGKLTESDLKAIAGDRSELINRIRKRYDLDEREAEQEAEAFIKKLH